MATTAIGRGRTASESEEAKTDSRSPGSSPRRVAQVVRPATGGMRRHVSLLIAALDRTRFTPLLCAPVAFTLEEIPGHPTSPVQHIPLEIGARTRPLDDLRTVATLTGLLRSSAQTGTSEDAIELVHAHGSRAALIGILAARRAGLPSLFTAHNLLPPMGRFSGTVFRNVANKATMIIAVSEAVANSLVANGVSESHITIISNGIDLLPFDRYEKAQRAERAKVVAIGRLSPEKGFDLLIDAFETVVQMVPDATLQIAGDGPERTALEARARRSPVADRIRLLGRLDDTIPLLHSATLVAVPSRQEGQGLVALEAMAARRPVVATAVGGLTETILPNKTGLLVSPESPAALAEALVALLLAPDRCRLFGENGRQRVERHYTLERMMDKIQSLYASL